MERPQLRLTNRRPPEPITDPRQLQQHRKLMYGFRTGLVHRCPECTLFAPVLLELDPGRLRCLACCCDVDVAIAAYVKFDLPKAHQTWWPGMPERVPDTIFMRHYLNDPKSAAHAEWIIHHLHWGTVNALMRPGNLIYSYRRLVRTYRDEVIDFVGEYEPRSYPAALWMAENDITERLIWFSHLDEYDFKLFEGHAENPDALDGFEAYGPLFMVHGSNEHWWPDIPRKNAVIIRSPFGEEDPDYEDQRHYA